LNSNSPQPSSASIDLISVKNLRWIAGTLTLIAVVALISALYLWSKLFGIEELLAKQSALSTSQSLEAKVSSKDAQDLSRETAAKLALLEAKVAEVALHRAQLEELMQSISRTRDDNLVAEIESSLRLAQQQAQATGSVQPLTLALKNTEQRLNKSTQTKLLNIAHAIEKDLDFIKSAPVPDVPSLLFKLDQLVQKSEDLRLLREPELSAGEATENSKLVSPASQTSSTETHSWAQSLRESSAQHWLEALFTQAWGQIKGLIRITKIDQPEASLLTPGQSFFLKENFKLHLLNAKLGLLAHQGESLRFDLSQAEKELNKYFDTRSTQGQSVSVLLKEIQSLSKQTELPSIPNTWSALSAATLAN
jgi:uroporphyrin-3 C-methyltransferase